MRTAIPSLWSTLLAKPGLKLSLAEAALYGVWGGLTFAAKEIMAPLPFEPVSLLVMLFAVSYGKRALYPIYVFVVMEFAWYGLGLWSINYLYIWLVLAAAAWLLRRMTSPLGWALLSGAFGLLFGALCTPVCLLIGDWAFALSWWINGIPFDLVHCGANFAIALALFCPLRKLLAALNRRYGIGEVGRSEREGTK